MATKTAKVTKPITSADGLNYIAKPAGSPFKEYLSNPNSKSCIKCGKHRLPEDMAGMKLAGRQYFKCKPACK